MLFVHVFCRAAMAVQLVGWYLWNARLPLAWRFVRPPARRLEILAVMMCATCVHAAPAFLDVTGPSQLTFFNEYGPLFVPIAQDMQKYQGNGSAVGDYDGDGDLDVYLLGNSGFGNVLYRNNLDSGNKTFTDVTAFAGVGDTGVSRVAHFVDLDNDGWLDLLLINDDDDDQSVSRIFRNNGDGSFTDVTEGSNFHPHGYLRCGAAIADYDQDGLLDIYVTNWGGHGVSGPVIFPGRNRLYRNLGGFVFEDVTSAVGLGILKRDSFTAVFVDFDEDNWPDIYVAVDHTSDEFYRNVGGTFVLVTEDVGTNHLGNDMGVACADFDDDGDLDIYATNITDPTGRFGTTQNNVFYVNQFSDTGILGFVDEAAARGVEDTYWGWGTVFLDVDNDGDLDLAAANGYDRWLQNNVPDHPLIGQPTVLFENDSTGQFTRVLAPGLEPGDDGRGLVAFDYDRDGDEDLLINNLNQSVRLIENITSPQGNWLDVSVSQKAGNNLQGIGVTVYASIAGITKRRDILAGSSYLVGTPSEVHFGLGSQTQVDELRIEWTDGSQSVYPNVAGNQRIHVIQDVPRNLVLPCDSSTDPALTGTPTADWCGDTSPNISYSDDVTPSSCAQQELITRTWTVTDSCGTVMTGIQEIQIVDTEAPAVMCPKDVNVICGTTTDPEMTGSARGFDNCDSVPTVTWEDVRTDVLLRTWTATDECGNSSSCEQLLTIPGLTVAASPEPYSLMVENTNSVKNRYLTFVPPPVPAEANSVALRVVFSKMPGAGDCPLVSDHSAFEGEIMWVGDEIVPFGVEPSGVFGLAVTPTYRDWNAELQRYCVGATGSQIAESQRCVPVPAATDEITEERCETIGGGVCLPLVIVSDCNVIPCAEYTIQAISDVCPETDEGASEPLVLATTPIGKACPGTSDRWADVVGAYDPIAQRYGPADGCVDFFDIAAMVERFKNLSKAPPRTWCDLLGGPTPISAETMWQGARANIDFNDISAVVKAFGGQAYPLDGPTGVNDPCP